MHTPPKYREGSRHYRILEEISAGDLFVGFLFSANSTRLMYKVARARARERYINRLAIEHLESCGYVERRKKNGNTVFIATKEGKRALQTIYEYTSRAIKRPQKWDGSWRIVSYDFPEKERSQRNALRHVLIKSHFLQIQKSVWVFPYECLLLSELLNDNPAINKRCIFVTANTISSDKQYRAHYHLQ